MFIYSLTLISLQVIYGLLKKAIFETETSNNLEHRYCGEISLLEVNSCEEGNQQDGDAVSVLTGDTVLTQSAMLHYAT